MHLVEQTDPGYPMKSQRILRTSLATLGSILRQILWLSWPQPLTHRYQSATNPVRLRRQDVDIQDGAHQPARPIGKRDHSYLLWRCPTRDSPPSIQAHAG